MDLTPSLISNKLFGIYLDLFSEVTPPLFGTDLYSELTLLWNGRQVVKIYERYNRTLLKAMIVYFLMILSYDDNLWKSLVEVLIDRVPSVNDQILSVEIDNNLKSWISARIIYFTIYDRKLYITFHNENQSVINIKQSYKAL